MRKTREILRLRWSEKRSLREIGASCGVSSSTVSDTIARGKEAGLTWPLPEDMDDNVLEAKLYPPHQGKSDRPLPDFEAFNKELRKRKGVTLELLWMEYREDVGERGYSYSHFCNMYRRWRKKLDVVMRQEHRAGEKMFVDFSGETLSIHSPSGEIQKVEIFVATLGASNYTYAEATEDQQLNSWLDAHIRALEFFDGSAEIWVPDNLKSGVKKSCLYEPVINQAYKELGQHYGAVVIPARKRKPKDKAKVENAVQQVERWVLAPLRNQIFSSLDEMNEAIRERLEWLNNRELTGLSATRLSLYQDVDRPALKPLPVERWTKVEWKTDVGVNVDHHVDFDDNYYSVPYQLVGKRVDIRATRTLVECWHKNNRVASHVRSYKQRHYTTERAHRPKAHQAMVDWTPERIARWAEKIGPETKRLVEEVMRTRPHPEQGFRSCLGIIRLAKRYSDERLENACRRALYIGGRSYKTVASILKNGLDKTPLPDTSPTEPEDVRHENIRGPEYYE